MPEAYIIDAVRTPRGVGKPGKGALSHLHPQHPAATVLKALKERNRLDTAEVDDIIWSTSTQKGKQGGDLARLGLVEVNWGMVPDMGGMDLLPDLVRPDRLAELLFTGRIVEGAEAVRIGLATHVEDDPVAAALKDDPVAAALKLAIAIASASPDAVRAAKRLLRLGGSRDDILRAEAYEAIALIGQPNQREAMAAGLEKRPARYVD